MNNVGLENCWLSGNACAPVTKGKRGVVAWSHHTALADSYGQGLPPRSHKQTGSKWVFGENGTSWPFSIWMWMKRALNLKWGNLVLGFASDERCGSSFPWPHWVLLLKVVKSAVSRMISSSWILFSVNYTNRTQLKSKDILFKTVCLTRQTLKCSASISLRSSGVL